MVKGYRQKVTERKYKLQHKASDAKNTHSTELKKAQGRAHRVHRTLEVRGFALLKHLSGVRSHHSQVRYYLVLVAEIANTDVNLQTGQSKNYGK